RSCRRASKLSERSTRRLSCSRYWIISPQESCEKLSEKTRHPISEARASASRPRPRRQLDSATADAVTKTQTGEFICVRFFASAMPILGVLCPECQNPVGDVDLHKLGGYPGATIASLIRSLPCRNSRRVCRSRSATLEDLAASNSSASAGAFIYA